MAPPRTRWQRRLWSSARRTPPSFDRILAGPDLNGDGAREIFTAAMGWRSTDGNRIVVTALSGADGRTLWQWVQPLSGAAHDPTTQSEPLAFWEAGEDGWPLLLVPVQSGSGSQTTTYVLSSGSGSLLHVLPDAVQPRVADLDGDGLADLFDTRWETAATETVARLFAVRGRSPESWKRLGIWQPAADFDGDGSTDLLEFQYESLTARAGRDGRLLWQTRSQGQREFLCPPLPYGDLDGDGTPDLLRFASATERLDSPSGVIGHPYNTISALSGKDGRRLWIADDVGMAGSTSGFGGGGSWTYKSPLLDWIDLDGDKRAEILAVYGTGGPHPELAVLSGEDGRMLWKTPIVEGGMGINPDPYRHHAADLDGDGVGDLVLWVPGDSDTEPAASELRAISGRSGETLWSSSAAEVAASGSNDKPVRLLWPRPAVEDVDGDGQPDVVVTLQQDETSNRANCHLLVLNGRTGGAKWSWSWRGFQGICPPLLVDFDGDGRRSVCLGIRDWKGTAGAEETETGGPTVIVLDEEGQLAERHPLQGPALPTPLAIWDKVDLNGDGREELLYYDDHHLRAYRGSGDEYLWLWRLPEQRGEPAYTSPPARLAEIRSSAEGGSTEDGPAEVVVWVGRRVYGLDGSAGQPNWRCDVRWSPGSGFSDPPTVELLATGDAANLPGVLCHWRQYQRDHWCTIVAQAWPTDAAGRYAPPAPRPRAYAPVPEERDSGTPLPWVSYSPRPAERLLHSAAIPAGLPALFALVLPVLLAWWTIRNASWIGGVLLLGYATLSILGPFPHALASLIALAVPAALLSRAVRRRYWPPAVVAVISISIVLAPLVWFHRTKVSPLGDFYNWLGWWWLNEGIAEPLVVSLVTLPGIAFWWYAARWISRRRWKKVATAVAASVLLAILFAAAMIRLNSASASWWPSEDYSWTLWYAIWFWGTFAVGLAVLLHELGSWLRTAAGRIGAQREMIGEAGAA